MEDANKQIQKSQSTRKHHTDPADYDGMGDFSRYRTMEDRSFTSLENDLKNWLNGLKSTISLRKTDA